LPVKAFSQLVIHHTHNSPKPKTEPDALPAWQPRTAENKNRQRQDRRPKPLHPQRAPL